MIDTTATLDDGSESVVHAISATASPDDLCPTCGRTIAQHHSSVGAAPRTAKILTCPACHLKAHQNIDVQTARLECLWRQFASATKLIKVSTGANGTQRVKLPKADVATVLAFGKWLEARESATPGTVDAQDTQTTSTAQRAAARAASAPPQPTDPTVEPAESSQESEPDPLAGDLEEQIREAAALLTDGLQTVGTPDGCATGALRYALANGADPMAALAALEALDPDQPLVAESDPDDLDVHEMVKSTVPLDALAW